MTKKKDDSRYNNLEMAFLAQAERLANPERDTALWRAHCHHLEAELKQLKENYNWVCDRLKQLETNRND